MPEAQVGKLFMSTEELTTAEESHINGNVPDYVKGTFIRVGPGKWDMNGFTMNHWLDGYSILSKFIINGDQVSFEKKFLRSEAYKRAMVAQKPVITEFGTKAFPDPAKSLFSRFVTSLFPIELTDNDQLSLFNYNSTCFATSETSFFHEIEPCNLSTGEKFDSNKCFGQVKLNSLSAHPQVDPKTGIMYNIGSTLLTGLKYHIMAIPPAASNQSVKENFKKSKTIATISATKSCYLSYCHSFGMTSKYIIFIEQPFVLNFKKAMAGAVLKTQSFKEWLEWHPEEIMNRFFIIEKETGKVLKTEIVSKDPFFFLHFINCYEEDDHIVMDLTVYPDPSMLDNMYLSKLRDGIFDEGEQPNAQRFVVPIVSDIHDVPENIDLVHIKTEGTAVRIGKQIVLTPEILTEKGFEMPVINKKYFGKKHNIFWATGSKAPGHFENALFKYDKKKRETILWREGNFNCPGEPVFIAKPNALREDEGVLISAVTDTRNNYSDFLLFLDATTMEELGRAKFKAHIPQSLHGIFLNTLAVAL